MIQSVADRRQSSNKLRHDNFGKPDSVLFNFLNFGERWHVLLVQCLLDPSVNLIDRLSVVLASELSLVLQKHSFLRDGLQLIDFDLTSF